MNVEFRENTTANSTAKKRGSYNPFYFVGEALRSAWRNRVMTIAAVLVLTSCLVLLGIFGLLIRTVNINLDKLGMLNEIVVFIDYDADKAQAESIGEQIKALDNVSYVEYVSKDTGLEEMIERYPDYKDVYDQIRNDGDNPLSDSFIVTYADNAGVIKLESDLHSIDGVRKVNNRLDFATKVESFKNVISVVFVWLFGLLFAVSIFVIFNTIKLAVHGKRAEISIMRFIGSTKAFITAPFVIIGVMIGTLSGVIAFIADAEIYKYVLRYAGGELKMLEFTPWSNIRPILLLGFIALGILTGVFSTLISLHKNVRS